MTLLFHAVLTLFVSTSITGPTTTLHVAPDGDDTAAGTRERPLATPAGARERIRAWRLDDSLKGRQIRVVLHEGDYRFTGALTLGEQDSGSPGAPVVYAAAPGAHVRLVGAHALPGQGWARIEDGSVLRTTGGAVAMLDEKPRWLTG